MNPLPPGGAPTILVVEDESIVARDIQSTLQRLGYLVPAVAATGEDARSKAAEFAPQWVLMDINIRGASDGIETALELRRRFGVRVIFLSAFSDAATQQRAQSAKPFTFLLKPFEADERRSVVEAALQSARNSA